MKYIKYAGIIFLATLVVVVSCKKEEETNPKQTTESFFTVSNATYHEGEMPAPQGSASEQPSITTIQGTHYVVPGGANTVSIIGDDAQGDINKIYVGVQGVDGYFLLNYGATKATDTIMLTLTLNNSIPLDSFTIVFELGDNAGNISEPTSLLVHQAEVQRGKLEISLSWDLYNDIDLHVVQPDSEEIFYGRRQSTEGGYLDLDSNAACSIDSINNEHVIYPDTAVILTGTYIVRVDFYSQCDYQDSSVTHYVVTARYNGELISPSSGTNPYEGTFQPFTDDGGGEGSGVEVMRFDINNTKSLSLYSFEFPSKNNRETKTKKPCKVCK